MEASSAPVTSGDRQSAPQMIVGWHDTKKTLVEKPELDGFVEERELEA